jgi:spermidine synthase
MGSNVIGRAVDALFGPSTPIHILEIEPTIVELCRDQGALASANSLSRFHCHIGDVRSSLGQMPRGCSLIFLDCYDPLASSMMHAEELIASCRDHLRDDGGVLVINAHVGIDFVSLAPFLKCFPLSQDSVHVAKLPGIEQIMVACWHSTVALKNPASIRLMKKVLSHLRQHVTDKQSLASTTEELPNVKRHVAAARTKRLRCESELNFFERSAATRLQRTSDPTQETTQVAEIQFRSWILEH